MFDNLIARAIVPVTIAVTGFVIFGCLLLYSFIKADLTASAFLTANNCADTVVKSTKSAMLEDNQQAIQNIVENIGTRADVKLIKIYGQDGKTRYSGRNDFESLSTTAEAHIASFLDSELGQTEVQRHEIDHDNGNLIISLPIFNEPQCSTADCHFHADEEEILGFFSIGISSHHLDETLTLLRNRMIIFSVMVLFLTVGGVTALLRMNLFLPILRLTYNAEQASQGVAEADLPKSDHKLGKLNRDFRLIVKQRDQALLALKALETPNRNVDNGSDQA
ncbi:hypothetical protein SAMN05660420_00129 [Desulfuromusa kysingii]|uniref:HAMP domain-containing protein n=1 Tax=Desulfuromusa kysingii TaxID=37625 RepID=A0A1H3VKJ3_9BACT|nr:hypothetical protein [Desulfuromusa kysingii]SDZ75323.1 hypothetical protein SAMN05660420_00129 [Desulfuromusa kysingii]